MRPSWLYLILVLVTCLHVGLQVYAAAHETPTVDEYAHVPAGLADWHYGAFALYGKSPPLIRLWMTLPLLAQDYRLPEVRVEPYGWGPWTYGLEFERANFDRFLDAFFYARLMIVILSLGTAGILFAWARALSGLAPAVFATCGFLLAPTVLAHGHLATTDMGATFFIFLTAALLARARTAAWLIGVAMGAALLAKFTALFLLPWFWWRQGARGPRAFLISVSAMLVVVNAGYAFKGAFPQIGDFKFQSRTLRAAPLPGWLYVPVPRDFVAGFDAQLSDGENGEFGNYLLGEFSNSGWWDYNIIGLGLKENPATLLLLLTLPFLAWRRPARWWVAVPLVSLGVPLMFLNPLQVGVRYLLPLFPLVFVLLALALARWPRLGGPALALWLVAVAMGAPSFISYFNPLATWNSEKDELLLDSNLDWGQDLYRVEEFARGLAAETPLFLLYFGHTSIKHYVAQYRLVPDHPVRGMVVVSPNFVRGMAYVTPTAQGFADVEAGRLGWLRGRRPTAHLGALLVYDLR